MLKGKGPTVMVGDSTPDIKGARSAGYTAIAVDFGYPDAPVEAMKPDAIISSLGDLPALLVFENS